MKILKIFRYENDTESGPYCAYRYDLSKKYDLVNLSARLLKAHQGSRHPCILVDISDEDCEKYDAFPVNKTRCGTLSRKSLANWFYGWKSTLESHGFIIVEYYVPEDYVVVGKSGKQVAFDLSYAEVKIIKP